MWTQVDKHFLILQLVWQQLLNYLKCIQTGFLKSSPFLSIFAYSVEKVIKQFVRCKLLNFKY